MFSLQVILEKFKMKKFYLFILTFFLLLSSFVFAEEMQYCCEKTTTESELMGLIVLMPHKVLVIHLA
jgi:hypothetical protein